MCNIIVVKMWLQQIYKAWRPICLGCAASGSIIITNYKTAIVVTVWLNLQMILTRIQITLLVTMEIMKQSSQLSVVDISHSNIRGATQKFGEFDHKKS
jgi:hypothetical protein